MQDVVLPVVPVVGLSPLLQWLLGVAAVVLPSLFSVLLVFLKQKFNNDKVTADGTKIANATIRGAALGAKTGLSTPEALAIGLAYVKTGVPEAIAATPQATDAHLTNMIAANLDMPVNKPVLRS